MKKIYILVLIGLYGCSPAIRAYYDYDKDDRIQKYKTYAWENEDKNEFRGKASYYSELTDRRIKSSVNDLLRAKGYLLTDGNSDLSLHYHIEMEERSVFWPDPDGYMYGDYFMRPRPDIFTYREVTLAISFISTKNKKLVWHGWAVAPLEVVNYDAADTDSPIRSVVTKILLNLPEATSDTTQDVSYR